MTGTRSMLLHGRGLRVRHLAAAAALLFAAGAFAGPGELTVISVGPMKEALADAVAKFESETGQTVAVNYTTRAQLKAKVHGADHPDIVIAAEDSMNQLGADGQTQTDTRMPLGRVGFGVAIKDGSTAPDVSSTEALKQALLKARSITYVDPAESPAGKQATAMVEKLGIADAVKAKTKLGTGSNPIGPVGFGDIEIALHPINEIMVAKGVKLAAPVPADVQQWTRYDAAIISEAPNQNEAKKLLTFLNGAAARASYKSKGFEAAN